MVAGSALSMERSVRVPGPERCEAIAMIQTGMKKQLKDPNNAQIRLGQAYLAAGQKAEAKAAFAKVKTPEKDAMVAHLWTLAAR